ncbi:hypothetical protein F5Y18DRAFT_170429 [Xylariaceae sp. FL1019]|nr:hypothetical protein F5Y18DRAFT_170429 [Xylariaceae sp. FL1019]
MMHSKKSLAAAESVPVDDEATDMGPRPDRRLSMTAPVEPTTARRRSLSSLRSESRPSTSVSCISRNAMSGEDCARQRFIVWAAVKRNRSVRMAASERLRCPLLRCGEHFDGHEEMLRHLTHCQHLSTGEYVCYECMKVERFNDAKCRCCSGSPTKRRRIINLAKHFFSNIGSSKSRRDIHIGIQDGPSCPPPSYDSLVDDVHERYGRNETEHSAQEGRQEVSYYLESQPQQPELNSTELLELDSRQLFPTAQLDAVNYDPQPATISSGTDARRDTAPLPDGNMLTEEVEQLGCGRIPSLIPAAASDGGRRPSLALDTHMDRYRSKPSRTAFLSPSSSLRSNSHGISPITPWSTSSGSSAFWSAGPTFDNSTTSPITPMSANPHATFLQAERLFSKDTDMNMVNCPDDSGQFALGDVPELPGDGQLPSGIPMGLSDPLMFSFDPKDNYSWMSSVDTEISLGTSVNMMFTDPHPRNAMPANYLMSQNPDGSEVKNLVDEAWQCLRQHISNSIDKLNGIEGNVLADQFRAQSPGAVATMGLEGFRKIMGRDYLIVPEPLEYLCFIHLMYSISLPIYKEDLMGRSDKLYNQAVAYGTFLDSMYRRDYHEIVSRIWKQDPRRQASEGRTRESQSRTSNRKGKEPDYHTASMGDPLLITGHNFLDIFENMALISDTPEVVTSELYSSHIAESQHSLQGNTPLTIASTFIVEDLRRNFGEESWLRRLKTIGERVQSGYYPTIRKLELELLQTGKDCLESTEFFDRFVPKVRNLCDQIYSQHGTRPRARYQLLAISLLDRLFQSIAREEAEQSQTGNTYFPINLAAQYDDEFLQGLDKTFYYDTGPSTQQSGITQGHADFDPTLDPIALHTVSHDIPLTIPASNPTLATGGSSESHSESYTISPAPLSDAQLDMVGPKSNRPTPPRQSQTERAGAAGPSVPSLTSSGAKVEANDCCEICGYRPKGDPQWFKGSMAKHKKMMHSSKPPIIYKCPFPGCSSEYKNRRDNLRQHQIEKNHFVGDDTGRRPQKRKKPSP